MNILVIGSGSYVIGDIYGPGVILRSVIQWILQNSDGETNSISITYNSPSLLEKKQDDVASILEEVGALGQLNVKFVASEETDKLLASGQVDACFISVPDKFHASFVRSACASNVPVWIVKPLTGNWEETTALVKLQNETGARTWVDYHKRFDVSNRLLKKQVEDQELGRLLAYSVDYHQPRTLPMEVFDWTGDVDVFTYIGCHYVDQLFFMFPEARLVSAVAEPLVGEVHRKTAQYDGVLATLKFETDQGPIVCPMNVGWFNPAGSPTKSLQTLKVQFERGLVELDQTRRGVHIWKDDGVAEVNPYFFCATPDPLGKVKYDGYGYESVAYFLDLVKTGGEWPDSASLPSLHEAAKTDFVVSVVQKALKTGEKLVID